MATEQRAVETQERGYIAPLAEHEACLGRIGSLIVRLATSPRERDAAQAIRYRIFAGEMQAVFPPELVALERDVDAFDDICDHLLVIDEQIAGAIEDRIVGCYRLLRRSVAERHAGFYSASEFHLDTLLSANPALNIMELGRSCVLPAWRGRRTLELLWQGIWAYALQHGIDMMIGCASFPGVAPQAHALPLSFLHHHARAEAPLRVRAVEGKAVAMDMMPVEAVDARRALMAMPPLIKGYLRLGARFGEDAVVDHAFNTTDVLVILPISAISNRYVSHYGADAGRFAS